MVKDFILASMNPRRGFLLLVLALVVMLGSVTPAPVYASCQCSQEVTQQTTSTLAQWAKNVKEWAQNFELLNQIISIGTSISNLFSDTKKSLEDKLDLQMSLELVVGYLQTKAKKAMHDEQVSATIESNLATVEAGAQVKYAMPPNEKGSDKQNKQHCYSVVVRMGLGLISFPKKVIGTVEDAINNAWRGPGKDGTSPSTAAALFYAIYGKTDYGWPKMANPVDNPDSSWIDDDKDFYDAHMNEKTLTQTMEYPEHQDVCTWKNANCSSGEQRWVPIPKSGNKEQKMWVAAELFCYTAAGARPSRPASSGMSTPDGIVISAQWDHCNAIRTAFVHQCAGRISRNTRPDCANAKSGSEDYMECQFQKKVCDAAKSATQSDDAKKMLGDAAADCDKGLTPYQTEYLSRLICLSGQRANNMAGGGANAPQITGMNDMCDLSMATWKAQLAAEETAFVTAMMGIHQLRDCWPSVNIRPSIKSSVLSTP